MYLFVCLSICLCFLQWQVLNYGCHFPGTMELPRAVSPLPAICCPVESLTHSSERQNTGRWSCFSLSLISPSLVFLYGFPGVLSCVSEKYIDTVNGKAVLTCLSAPLSSVCRPLYVLSVTATTGAGVRACVRVCVRVYMNAGFTDIPPLCFQTILR